LRRFAGFDLRTLGRFAAALRRAAPDRLAGAFRPGAFRFAFVADLAFFAIFAIFSLSFLWFLPKTNRITCPIRVAGDY
jgi:hypothetical protein